MKTRTIVLLLILAAGPALAQEADTLTTQEAPHSGWMAVYDGTDPRKADDAWEGGTYLLVFADPLVVTERACALTSVLVPNVSESKSDCATTWFTLTYSGSEDTSDHKWRISARIWGDGEANADASACGSSWFDGKMSIEMSGDLELAGKGALQVHAAGTGGSVSLPPGVTIESGDGQSEDSDSFKVDDSLTNSGEGKSCRVKVVAKADGAVHAECSIGSVIASAVAYLHANLRMEGSYTVKGTGQKVKEVFEIRVEQPECKPVVTEEPELGWGPSREEYPPEDTPTEEERENGRELEYPFRPIRPKQEPAEGEADGDEPEGSGPEDPAGTEEPAGTEPEDPAGTEEPEGGSYPAGGYPPPSAR